LSIRLETANRCNKQHEKVKPQAQSAFNLTVSFSHRSERREESKNTKFEPLQKKSEKQPEGSF